MIQNFEINQLNDLSYKVKAYDNFLNQEDYNELKEFCRLNFSLNTNEKSTGDKKFNIFDNKINDQGIIKSTIDPSFLKRLHRNYHQITMNILKELCPSKVKLYDYSNFSIEVTSKNSKFPIHDDIPSKLLSGVIYIYPENNNATIFYSSKKGENKKTIEWKQNRGVFFSRKERETWHSYESDGRNDRITLIYNLMTLQADKAVIEEGKNVFLSKLRHKLNPYFYTYFNKTF